MRKGKQENEKWKKERKNIKEKKTKTKNSRVDDKRLFFYIK